MDIRTMYLVLGLGYLVFGLMLLLFQLREDLAHRIPFFAGAKILQGIGALLFYGRGVLPDFFTIIVANCCLFVGFAYECWAVFRISGRPVSRALHLSTAVVVSLICIAYSLAMTSPQRIVVASILHVVFFALPAWALLTYPNRKSWLPAYLGGSYALLAVVFAARTSWALFAGADDFIFTASTIHQIVFAFLYYMMLTSGFGILLLAKEQSDDELCASEARFRSYFELPIAGVARTSPAKGWLEVNGGLCAMLGYSAQELAGLTWADLTHPDDLAADEAQFRRVLAGEIDTYDMEKRFIRKDGNVMWAALSTGCVRKPDGSVDYFFALVQDITARRRAEEALQASEEALREVSHIAKVGGWNLDMTTNKLTWTNETYRIHEVDPHVQPQVEEAINFYAAEARPVLQKALERTLEQGEPYDLELPFVTAKGNHLWVRSIGNADQVDGRTVRMYGVFQDITERKRAEEALRENALLLRTMAENYPNSYISIIEQDLTIGYTAGQEFKKLNLDPSQFVGLTLEQIFGGHAPVVRENYLKAFTGVETQFELFINDQYQHYRTVPLTDQNGRVTRILAVVENVTERKQAEAALHEAEQRFRSMFERHKATMLLIEPGSGAIVDANAAAADFYGFSLEELRRMKIDQINCLAPEEVAAERQRALTEQRSYFIFPHRLASGETRTVEVHSTPITVGEQTLLFSIIHDISQRVAAEEALHFTQFVLDHTMAAAFWAAADGRMIYVNEAACTKLEYTSDELLAMHVWDIVPNDSPERWAAHWETLKAQGAQCFESQHLSKSGLVIPVEIQTNYVQFKDRAYACGMARDITERKQAEAILRESERRFRAVLEQSELVSATLDLDANITFINDALLAITGWQREEVMGRNWFDVFIPPQAAERQDLFAGVGAGTVPLHYENEILTRTGQRRFIAWNNVLLRDTEDAITGITGIGVDITERKQTEEALIQARDAAEAANRAKSQFLANMSHELRTPLNAILGFSELMARDPGLTADQRGNLAIINRSGEHLLGVINDVLDMAKIDAGRLTLQEQDFDLHCLLVDQIELFSARAEAKGLTLVLTQRPDVPQFVHGDESKLRQVLLNLLGNAVKFTAAGSVDLSVALVASPAADAVCTLRFAVRDTGSGILPAEQEAIFEPFVQAASGRVAPAGTGLGLPISRQFARLMGGELTVASTGVPGEGSCFTLVLPLRQVDDDGKARQPAAGRPIALAPGQPVYRLLVVDDNATSRKLLEDFLTELGFDVRTAVNGQAAVQVWEEWQPHLIWMDMRMPVLDGHAATRQIKGSLRPGQQTVIVAVSAGALAEDRSTVLADGCDDFVPKPIRIEAVVAQLVKHLGVRFTYADTPRDRRAADPLAGRDFAGLPAGWVVQVHQAALAADAAQLQELADAVESKQPALAAALRSRVEEFDYGAILSAVASTETPWQ